MVAAVGLVLGPVLGRGARTDRVASGCSGSTCRFALVGSLWGGLVLSELAKAATMSAALDPFGTLTFVGRPGGGSCSACRRAACRGGSDPVVIVSLGPRPPCLLPLFVLIEDRGGRAPCSTSRSSKTACSPPPRAAAFINGAVRALRSCSCSSSTSRGAQGDSPLTAGIKLAPMAIGMLIASPLAGVWADRRWVAPWLAALGMVCLGGGAGRDDHPGARGPRTGRGAVWLFVVGVGSGHVQLAQTPPP